MGENPSKGINCPKCRSRRNVFCEGKLYAPDVWTQYRCGGCNVLFAIPKAQADKILGERNGHPDQ